MDGLVNDMLGLGQRGDNKVLVVVGGTEFNPSAPIKKYRRCPGVRKFTNFIKKHRYCDVVFADEYNYAADVNVDLAQSILKKQSTSYGQNKATGIDYARIVSLTTALSVYRQ